MHRRIRNVNTGKMQVCWTWRLIETDWGAFGVVMTEEGKVAATYLPQSEFPLRKLIQSRFPAAREVASGASSFCQQVRDYFAGKKVRWEVELAWGAIDGFRRRVLEACRKIPYGATASYSDLARAAGSEGAARAVGSTMANNPLPLIVPCHRVLRSDGSIGGFSSPSGTSQKERMLRLENPNFGQVRAMASRRKARSAKANLDLAFA